MRQNGPNDQGPNAWRAAGSSTIPTESTMRMGLLFAMQGSMSGMGETAT